MNDNNNIRNAAKTSDVLGRWDSSEEKTVNLTVYNSDSGTIILSGDRHSINTAAAKLRSAGSYSYERIEQVCKKGGRDLNWASCQFLLLVRDSVAARDALQNALGLSLS